MQLMKYHKCGPTTGDDPNLMNSEYLKISYEECASNLDIKTFDNLTIPTNKCPVWLRALSWDFGISAKMHQKKKANPDAGS